MPPPGFGPKIDKKKQEAEAAIIPPSERYSIRVERQDEEAPRKVLAAAQKLAARGRSGCSVTRRSCTTSTAT